MLDLDDTKSKQFKIGMELGIAYEVEYRIFKKSFSYDMFLFILQTDYK